MTTKISLLPTTQSIGWGSGTADLLIQREAANTLALRNGVSAQTFNIYNTYTDASNYERGVFDWSTTAGTLTIGTAKAGTGTTRALNIVVGGGFKAQFGAAALNLEQGITFNTDNTYDVGASGANRPRNAFIAGYVKTGTTVVGSLPSAATAGAGARHFVTDASAPAFGATVVGGGAVNVPVYSDGTNWKVG